MNRAPTALLLPGIAWGGLAFGAVYPWAYAPLLLCGCASAAYVAAKGPWLQEGNRSLLVGFAAVAAACGLQLVPVPMGALSRLDPQLPPILRSYVLGLSASAREARHTLTLSPRATLIGLTFLVALAALLLTVAAALDRRAIATLIRGIAVIGTTMALVGIVQAPFLDGLGGRIYGFWAPMARGNPEVFGPFVNRNHFAGWMLMALPLTLGYLAARVHRHRQSFASGVRTRIVWLSSPEASEIVLLAAASLIMGLSVAMTRSRSGLIGLTIALLLAAMWVSRSSTGWRRGSSVAFTLFLLGFSLWWAGFGPTATRFQTIGSSFYDRLGIWNDAWNIGRRFPLTGTGLNTYGIATLYYQTVDPRLHFDQAHNDYLQLFAEGGVLLCVPAAATAWLFARRVASRLRQDRKNGSMIWIRRGAIAGLVAIAAQEAADFSLQMPGNAFLFVILGAIALSSPSEAAAMPVSAR